MTSLSSLPNIENNVLEISRELLGTPLQEGNQQPSLKYFPLKEDSDYLVYEDGRVYSNKAQRFLKGKIDNVGYRVYSLAIPNPLTGKIGKMMYAHRLVAEYFIPNPMRLPQVHHKDENKLNNHYSNLEWVDSKINAREHILRNPNCQKNIKPHYLLDNLQDEVWMIVQENPKYSVSNRGRVINNSNNRLIKLDSSQRYIRVSFNDKKHYYLHRLVYCTFNDDYDLAGYVIDHIDRNPKNNNLENLQKITVSENNLRRFNDQASAAVGASAPKCETPRELG